MSDIGLNAGTAYILVLPDMSQLAPAINAALASAGPQLANGLGQAGTQGGNALEQGITSGVNRSRASLSLLGSGVSQLGGVTGPIGAIFTQMGATISSAFDRASSSAESARGRIGAALTGIGAAAAGLGVIFESFGGPLEKSLADLETTIDNAGGSIDDYAGRISAAEKQGEKFGFRNADVAEGLSRLTAAFQDPNKALDESTAAMTLAAAAHESFFDATKQIASGLEGQFRWAKPLGIDVQGVAVTTAQADAATKKYQASVVSLSDAQQRLSDFEDRLDQRRANSIESTAAAVEAADQRQADADQNLVDLRERQAEDNDAQAQKVIDADARVADAEQNLADQQVSLADSVRQARENLADQTEALNQRVADSEQNLADLQVSLVATVAEAHQRTLDDAAAGARSIEDAEGRLQDLQQRDAAAGNPRLLALLAHQREMEQATQAVTDAKKKAADQAEKDRVAEEKAAATQAKQLAIAQKQLDAAEKSRDKGIERGNAEVTKAETAETRGLETANKQLAAAIEARHKVDVEGSKLAVSQAREMRKALEEEQKATDALAIAREKAATAGDETLSESQQEARLVEEVARKQQAMDDDKARADELNNAMADNARKLDLVLDQLMAKYDGINEARAKTWSGTLKRLLTETEDFVARAGEKLAKPLQIAGPLAFIGGALLRGRGGSAGSTAGSAAGSAAGAAAGAGAGAAAGGAAAIEGAGIGEAAAASLGIGAAASVGVFAAAVAAAGLAVYELYQHSKVFHAFVDDAWQQTQKIVKTAWEDVIGPVLGFIGDHWRGLLEILAPGFYLIIDNWKAIAHGLEDAWGVMKPVFGFIVDLGLAVIIDTVKVLWHVWDDQWKLIAGAVDWAWDNVLKPVFSAIGDHLGEGSTIRNAMTFLGTAWDALWHGMAGVVSSVWDDIKGFVNRGVQDLGTIIGGVLGVVATIAEHIPGADDVASVLRDAQHSVRDWGKDSGVGTPAPVSGQVASASAVSSANFAAGGGLGWTPIGAGFVTSRETAIVHEGGPYPEFVIPTDPAHRDNARNLYAQLGPKLLAGGGWLSDLVGGVEHAVGDAAGFIADLGRKGAASVVSAAWPTLPLGSNLLSLVPGGINAIRSAVIEWVRGKTESKKKGVTTGGTEVGGEGWQELENYLVALAIPHIRTSDFREGDPGYHGKGLAADFVGADGSGEDGMVAIFNAFHDVAGQLAELIHNPSGGVKNGEDVPASFWGDATWDAHRNHVHAAIEAATRLRVGGTTTSATVTGDADFEAVLDAVAKDKGLSSDEKDDLRIIGMGESRGRNIAQEVDDVNSQNGDPAFGPFQIIRSTFEANKDPGHDDWHNPEDSGDAAVNYARGRYGSLDNVPGVKAVKAGEPYVGYAGGGVLANWAGVMDSGGVFKPGLNVAQNNTGADEHLVPVGGDGAQMPTVEMMAAAIAQAIEGMSMTVDGEELGRITSEKLQERAVSR